MMKKKKEKKQIFTQYILPSDSVDQISFIKKYKTDMMEQVLNSIEYAIGNNFPYIEVFQFKNSNFVIIISQKDFLSNLKNISDYCENQEVYELYPKIKKLKSLLNISDEK